MNSIELMVEEHKYIVRMLKVVRRASSRVMTGEEINYEDFAKMIDFIAGYADSHHHGKEEKILFREMTDNLGQVGTNLINHGMLVEHDWGRLFISELRAALERAKAGDAESRLDVIANAVGYANHLGRHIVKEDTAVYTFAENRLAPDVIARVNKETEEFEKKAERQGIQTKYLGILNELEKKYPIEG